MKNIKFSFYGENLKDIMDKFHGCPLKDEDGNIIGTVDKITYDDGKLICEASLKRVI